jgi:hypothetical protein
LRRAFDMVPPWRTGKSTQTNVVEGIHNGFRNGIATLKRRSSADPKLIVITIKIKFYSTKDF